MTERDALLTAALADPDDDLPRFIMADYLEEHGERGRAVHIRAQVELPHLASHGPPAADYLDALGVEVMDLVPPAELWASAAADGLPLPAPQGPLTRWWSGDLDRVSDEAADVRLGFRRGMAEEVGCRSAYWLEYAAQFVARAPLRRVSLTDKEPAAYEGEWYWVKSTPLLPDGFDFILPSPLFPRLAVSQAIIVR